MRVEYVPWIGGDGFGMFYVYAVACHGGGDVLQVKIGFTCHPHRRYVELLQRIPFQSTMIYAEAGNRSQAMKVENRAHRQFEDLAIGEEWFKFSVDQKPRFREGLNAAWKEIHGILPTWSTIHDHQASKVGLGLSDEVRKMLLKKVGRTT